MFARIFSILLIAIVLVPVLGTFPVFLYRQAGIRSEVKRELKNGVPEGELHKIAFRSRKDIHWTRPEKEFTLNGRMFDVVKNVSENGRVEFLCINDLEEELLFTNLDDLVNRKHKKHSGNYQWSVTLLANSLSPDFEILPLFHYVFGAEKSEPVDQYSLNMRLGHPDDLFSPPRS